MPTFTDKAWDGSASRWPTAAAYCSSCLIDDNPAGAEKTKDKCHLPIREPGGAVNKAALRAAASRLNQVQTSSEKKARARSRLRSLMNQAGMETSLSEVESVVVHLADEDVRLR